VHRTYVHIIKPEATDANRQRAVGLLDFRNQWDCDFKPESMIGSSSASYLTVTWNMKRAYDNIGPIFDAFLDEKAFDKFVESFKKELNVDLGKLVGLLGNRITVVSNAKRPIGERSERVAFFIPIIDQSEDVAKWIEKLVSGDGEIVEDGNRRYIVTSSEEEEPDFGDIDPVFDDPDEAKEKQEEEAALYLFEKKYILVERNYIIVANDWDYVKELLDGTEPNLAEEEDYKAVSDALDKMIVRDRLSAREFGRIDRMLETNYEMLRQGKMATSQTAMARILNRLFKTKDVPANFRSQLLQSLSKGDYIGAQNLAQNVAATTNSPLARIAAVGAQLRANGAGDDELQAHMDEALSKEISNLDRRTGFLGMFGNVATLLGLLGT
ncbi:MAG: MotA/TolQ/ExbB proton channel family protein, partial [Planctomycetota bacterium]